MAHLHYTQAFTNEEYEKEKFGEAVRAYQSFSITTQASLSLLNIIQQVMSFAHKAPSKRPF